MVADEQFREALSFVTNYPEVYKFLEDTASKMGWSKNKAFDFIMLNASKEFNKNPKSFVDKLLALHK